MTGLDLAGLRELRDKAAKEPNGLVRYGPRVLSAIPALLDEVEQLRTTKVELGDLVTTLTQESDAAEARLAAVREVQQLMSRSPNPAVKEWGRLTLAEALDTPAGGSDD